MCVSVPAVMTTEAGSETDVKKEPEKVPEVQEEQQQQQETVPPQTEEQSSKAPESEAPPTAAAADQPQVVFICVQDRD